MGKEINKVNKSFTLILLENRALIDEISLSDDDSNLHESFGKDTKEKNGSIIIPAKSNLKIKSPVNGKVVTLNTSTCNNEITIQLSGSKGYLQFCGITQPSVRDGYYVGEGDILGKTKSDVSVSLFNNAKKRVRLKSKTFGYDQDSENEKLLKKKSKEKEYQFHNPAMAVIPNAIASIFKDKVDKEGNVEKRMGYATDKKPVDPWIVNAVSKPFKKLGKFLGTNKDQKIQENIEKIKKLL